MPERIRGPVKNPAVVAGRDGAARGTPRYALRTLDKLSESFQKRRERSQWAGERSGTVLKRPETGRNRVNALVFISGSRSYVDLPMSGVHSESPRFGVVGTNALARLGALAESSVRAVAFWAAVVFPLAYLPLLRGGVAASELLPFLALLAANLLALTVGHDYRR
jgi:hypothetical protein